MRERVRIWEKNGYGLWRGDADLGPGDRKGEGYFTGGDMKIDGGREAQGTASLFQQVYEMFREKDLCCPRQMLEIEAERGHLYTDVLHSGRDDYKIRYIEQTH